MKEEIIDILKSEAFQISDETGFPYTVIDECDFERIAEKILVLLYGSDNYIIHYI